MHTVNPEGSSNQTRDLLRARQESAAAHHVIALTRKPFHV